uniref:GNAT family N-acetyltransferase n=1 Tax=Fulvivirga sp. TaxID=1931237 RepID=UPI0040491DEA
MKLIRTDSKNTDFINLVSHLDADLAEKDGDDHAFYHQFNSIDTIKYAVVAYRNDQPVGCGAIKEFSKEAVEVKRMFVFPEHRGSGIASKILAELEEWARMLGYTSCVLETGLKQVEALALYQRRGYKRIPNYGQYAGVENSVCFEKGV